MYKLSAAFARLLIPLPYTKFVQDVDKELKTLGVRIRKDTAYKGPPATSWGNYHPLIGYYYGKKCIGFVAWDEEHCRIAFNTGPDFNKSGRLMLRDTEPGKDPTVRFADWRMEMLSQTACEEG